MTNSLRLYIIAALGLLIATLTFGMLASWAFLYPEVYNKFLPFHQLRPFHVSAALFWIISGATVSILFYKSEALSAGRQTNAERLFIFFWIATVLLIFLSYGFKKFGGREYWEFPPLLCIPLLVSWLLLSSSYFVQLLRSAWHKPMYVWMWTTGIFFFLITFAEQNLWQIPWFRESYLREITVQWKANGASVGAWNQMIYGTSLFLMVKISGNENIARGRMVFFFYMLGLTNLMFNWGHHIYNVPAASWIRGTSYVISMTEWVFLIRMIRGFRNTLDDRRRFRHLLSYRFLIAAEFWVFMNLLLTLAMSVPAVNRYTHGTHITVAHAMGSTIGVNTMILLASFTYMLDIDRWNAGRKNAVSISYWVSQYCLGVFWLSLIVAGAIKGYRSTAMEMSNFQEVMKPVLPVIKVFSLAGIGLAISLGTIAVHYIYRAMSFKKVSELD